MRVMPELGWGSRWRGLMVFFSFPPSSEGWRRKRGGHGNGCESGVLPPGRPHVKVGTTRARRYFGSAFNASAAAPTSDASAWSTAAMRGISVSTCFHCFCSIASRTPGIVFTPYPV